MNYLDLSIREIHQALVEKKTTPLELVEEALRRAKANKDNAFEMLCEEEAIAFAKSLGEPEEDNLLWGIPYCSKDNFSTKGKETTASSNILVGYVPLFDATVIEKLNAKKAIMIGKTTLDELAMGGTGTTGHKGITYNPYDPSHKRMCGGSSCGSAAVVSAGIVPFALGSDTGDSVRKPASYTGLVGMKPTWGRISRYGLFPFAPSLDHVGFFTRYVEDSAILLGTLSGRDDRDSTSSFKPVEDYVPVSSSLKGTKIAIIKEIVDSIKDEKLRLIKEGKLKKMDIIDSTIFRGDDNKYYEQIGQETIEITEDIPFEIPSNWEWCRLRDICSIFTGATFKKDEAKTDCKGVRILRGGNILPFEIIQKTDDIFLSPEQIKESILLKQNDIITPAVTSLENIGKMARVEQNMPNITVGGFVFVLRPHYSDEWISKFLLFFMSSPSAIEFMKSITNKSGQAFYNIGKERLAMTLVPIPPKDEERRIVVKIEDLLDRIKGN